MTNENWDWQISSKPKLLIGFTELKKHKDLLFTFVRRELLSSSHQTVMGVLWILIQPILNTLFFLLVFGNIVKVSTDGIPPILFYMSGSILWSFYSDCLMGGMYAFVRNGHIFNKVYFPRLVVPLSNTISNFVRFSIQFILFLIIFFLSGMMGQLNFHLLVLLPFIIILTASFGLASGLIISIFMAKYKDVEQIMNFVIRLFMFVTPVVYPASIIAQKYTLLFWLNPLTPLVETFRSLFFGQGIFQPAYFFISAVSIVVILGFGLVLFKKHEVKIMDII